MIKYRFDINKKHSHATGQMPDRPHRSAVFANGKKAPPYCRQQICYLMPSHLHMPDTDGLQPAWIVSCIREEERLSGVSSQLFWSPKPLNSPVLPLIAAIPSQLVTSRIFFPTHVNQSGMDQEHTDLFHRTSAFSIPHQKQAHYRAGRMNEEAPALESSHH